LKTVILENDGADEWARRPTSGRGLRTTAPTYVRRPKRGKKCEWAAGVIDGDLPSAGPDTYLPRLGTSVASAPSEFHRAGPRTATHTETP